MKKIALIAMTAAAAIATPAMAQTVTGTINITGNVPKKCYVGTNTEGRTFGTSVDLEEITKADGTLKDTGVLAAKFGAAGGSLLNAKVVCNGATPDVKVTAGALKHKTLSNLVAPEGYSNTVKYKADVTFTLTSGAVTVTDDADDTGTTQNLTLPLSTTAAANVSVATKDWTASGVLIAGAYEGNIIIDVQPGA